MSRQLVCIIKCSYDMKDFISDRSAIARNTTFSNKFLMAVLATSKYLSKQYSTDFRSALQCVAHSGILLKIFALVYVAATLSLSFLSKL